MDLVRLVYDYTDSEIIRLIMKEALDAWFSIIRVRHGYGKTHRFSKTGSAGTGTVVDFSTPWHTAYLYRSIAGMARVNLP